MADVTGSCVVVYGPKAVGKSAVTRVLHDELGIPHVDAESLVLELLADRVGPDPRLGWLRYVEDAVRAALTEHRVVSVEATGGYESDWLLLEDLAQAGVRVVPVWVWAPEEVALRRLAERNSAQKVAISEEEGRRIHRAACAHAERRRFCVSLDTSAPLNIADVVDAVRSALQWSGTEQPPASAG